MTDREIDVLVAERVMGWKPGCTPACDEHWRDANDKPVLGFLPHFSTDIAHTWLVVEKMRASGLSVSIHCPTQQDWLVEIQWPDYRCIEVADDTAPKAICLAALRAVDGIKDPQ